MFPGKDDPVNKIKSVAKNFIDGFWDNLMDSEVINKRDLQQLGTGISNFIKGTENLFEELKEKTEKGNPILMVIGNPKKQLSLSEYLGLSTFPPFIVLLGFGASSS